MAEWWTDADLRDRVQLRQGVEADRSTETFLEGEPVWTTDDRELHVGDGTTGGGVRIGFGHYSVGPASSLTYGNACQILPYTTAAWFVGFLGLVPIPVGRTAAFTKLSTYCQTASAGTNCRLKLYENGDGIPGALVEESGAISTATTGTKTFTLSSTLQRGWYWGGIEVDSAVPTFRASDTGAACIGNVLGFAGFGNFLNQGAIAAHAFGAGPDPPSVAAYTALSIPLVTIGM